METKTRILVMDDEPLARLMVCSALEGRGILVSEAGSCAEALGLVRNTAFDAAIFDYRLDDGDGLELLRRLRKEGIGFPVIMLSGESSDIEEEAQSVAGVCAVLSKPPDMDKVVELLEVATECKPAARALSVGRYAVRSVSDIAEKVTGDWDAAEWLAVDFSELESDELAKSVETCLRRTRVGVAVLGAKEVVQRTISSWGLGIEFVSNLEELAALSRHPSTPAERSALLGVRVERC